MSLFRLQATCLIPVVLGMSLCSFASGATFFDGENLIALTVTPAPSSTPGHLAWQFEVVPVDSGHEISSVDAAAGNYGFSGSSFRNVNPNELPTVFADYNAFFPSGEDATTDTQFSFVRSNLTVVPNSALESSSALQATFTGFPAIRVDGTSSSFAQIVMPSEDAGEFYGAFALRPIGGGLAQLVEIGPIAFSIPLGDFDFDADVDGSDFLEWQRSDGTTAGLSDWQTHFAMTNSLAASTSVPEPSSLLLATLGLCLAIKGRRRSKDLLTLSAR